MNTTKVYANMLATVNSGRLDGERIRRVVECKTVGDAFKALADYGYAYRDGDSVDEFIVNETDKLIEFIEDVSPSESVKSALTARFVYNNAKLAYKSRFAEIPDDGYYDVSFDSKKIADGDYSETDKFMAEALEALDALSERRPQAIDMALTRAMYRKVLSCKSHVINKYFRAEIDMKNILTAARMHRLGTTGDEFLDGGRIEKSVLDEAVTSDDFAGLFENTPHYEYAERIEANDFKDLWRAERDSDDYLYYLTDSDVKNFSSYKPLLNYYTGTLIELKTVKTALVCIKTDSRDIFYSRIPEIYKK